MKLPAKVYAIRHDITGKIYVGCTGNLRQRLCHHLASLRRGEHPVEDMQSDYNLYGEHYTISVLDEINQFSERHKEFKWQIKLGTLDRQRGYNYKDPVTRWYNRPKA